MLSAGGVNSVVHTILHGVNLHRAAMQDAGSEAWADAMDKVVIALMIEKKEANENLEAMLAVPGVDMVQFGPAAPPTMPTALV